MDEMDLLLKIYIGQHINFDRGLLYKFKDMTYLSPEEEKLFSELEKKKTAITDYAYSSCHSIVTLKTTKSGNDRAKEYIKKILNQDTSLIEELINAVPKKLLGFFILDLNESTFETSRSDYYYDWKSYFLNNGKIFDFYLKFIKILYQKKLAVLTHDYVATRGGRIDPEKYVISNEFKEYIVNKIRLKGLSKEEIKNISLFFGIYQIKEEILDIEDNERRRNRYWDLLQELSFNESSIKLIINEFAKEKITSNYSEIDNENFLFSIHDGARFDIKLGKLFEEIIQNIINENEKLSRFFINEPTQILERHAALFVLIGKFEIQIRKMIIDEMRLFSKNSQEKDWYNRLKEVKIGGQCLYEKLKLREQKEKEEGILPETELIYYANILDYKKIILCNWEIFVGKFSRENIDIEKFEHGMDEINKIRNKVMHLRQIRENEVKTISLYIIPELEKVL